MSCICQNCKRKYKIDLIISDDKWEKIKPKVGRGSGLLCGSCIINELEKLNIYDTIIDKNFIGGDKNEYFK